MKKILDQHVLNNNPTVEKTDFIQFLLRDSEKVLGKTHVKLKSSIVDEIRQFSVNPTQ